jgi:hypothetical protein
MYRASSGEMAPALRSHVITSRSFLAFSRLYGFCIRITSLVDGVRHASSGEDRLLMHYAEALGTVCHDCGFITFIKHVSVQ